MTRLDWYSGPHEEWDAALEQMEGRTFCHLGAWNEIFAEGMGHEVKRLVSLDGAGRITGLLPLVLMRSRLFGTNAISLAFLNYGGPLGPIADRRMLVHEAVRTAQSEGAQFLELRTRQHADLGLTPSRSKVSVILQLPSTAEELWEKGIRAKLRSQVRRPKKAGMVAMFGTSLLPDFYAVFSRNMRDLGTPVLPYGFFSSICGHLSRRVILCVVYADEVPVAAGLGFLYGAEFEITWASSLRQYSREAPNMLLYWSLMERAIGRGAQSFNFGRCTPGSGTHRFKAQWGGSDHPLHWCSWSANRPNGPPDRERRAYSIASALWKRMPLSLANAIGPRVARGLPSF